MTAIDKGVLLLGAAGLVGREIALHLGAMGIPLVLHGRRKGPLLDLQQDIARGGGTTSLIAVDLEDFTRLPELLRDSAGAYGGLKGIIYCAGVFDDFLAETVDPTTISNLINVNVRAMALLCLHSIPLLEKVPQSFIINISSVAGRQLLPESPAYAASKFAAFGFSESLFEKVKEKGIRVSVIGPGQVSRVRGENGAGYSMPAEDIAKIVAFLIDFSAHSCITEVVMKPQIELPGGTYG
jgi:NADP-dependent 3-hydroxy acid dehydrogenase YdfG